MLLLNSILCRPALQSAHRHYTGSSGLGKVVSIVVITIKKIHTSGTAQQSWRDDLCFTSWTRRRCL